MAQQLADDLDTPTEELDEEERGADTFDRVMKVFYAAVITVEVFYIADVLTRGALSRAVEPYYWRARTLIDSTVGSWQHEQEIRRAERHVVWAAIEALDDGATA